MLAALPCERCCLRTLPAGSGLATRGPRIGLAKLAYGPTMGLWTWLLMGLASPCCGLACRSSCYLRTCLAPATASKLPEKFWISTRGLGKFRMWLAASGPGRSCKFDQAACLRGPVGADTPRLCAWLFMDLALGCPAVWTHGVDSNSCGPTLWGRLLAELACGPNPARSCADGRSSSAPQLGNTACDGECGPSLPTTKVVHLACQT